MEYKFWNWKNSDTKAVNQEYKGIRNPKDLYDALSHIWCSYTCAPRLRDNWSEENKTLGQCSITAFLAQDIFGGKVYGILRDGGNYHCFNVIGNVRFDLTSEQFGDEKLNYDTAVLQSRDVHFAKLEKKLRYEYLKDKLSEYCELEAFSYDTLRDIPDFKNEASSWFHEKWGVSQEEYLKYMNAYLNHETEYGWYLCTCKGKIIGGLGVISNDSHNRLDLTPNISFLYTEEEYRDRGIAGNLLFMCVEDLKGKGITPVYLLSDYEGFYEKYGWTFYDYVKKNDKDHKSRMYIYK